MPKTRELLLQEIDQMPEELLEQVLNFARFLNLKHLPDTRIASIMSESTFTEEPISFPEEEAWRDV
jgi:hypothetical protein